MSAVLVYFSAPLVDRTVHYIGWSIGPQNVGFMSNPPQIGSTCEDQLSGLR